MSFLLGGTSIGESLLRIGADTSKMRAELTAMNAQIKGEMAATGKAVQAEANNVGTAVQTQSAKVSNSFNVIKYGLLGIGAGLALFTVDAIKTSREFDQAMAKVYALTGQTKEQMASLQTQVLQLATVVPQSPTLLAQGLYYVVSAGYSATDAMKIMTVAAKDATVGLTDTQTVADGLTSAMNAYGYSADQASHVSDVMTNTVTQGKMEWSDLASAIGAVAVQGSTAGVSLEQVSAALATATRDGLTTAKASKNLAFLLRDLSAPSGVASDAIAAVGVKFDSTTLKSKGLYDTLKMISDAAGGMTDNTIKMTNGVLDEDASLAAATADTSNWAETMKAATGGAAGFLMAQILLQRGGVAYNQIMGTMADVNGMTADSFNRMVEADPGLMFDLLKNKVQVAAIEFGQELMPTLDKVVWFLVDALPKALDTLGAVWDSTLYPVISKMIAAFADLGAVILGIFADPKTAKGGDAFRESVQSIANVVAQVAKEATVAADALKAIFSNPLVQAATRLVAVLVAANIALRTMRAASSGLGSMFASTVNLASGGLLMKPAAATSATPFDPAAKEMSGAATKMDAAATKMDAAATKMDAAATKQKVAAAEGGEAGIVAKSPVTSSLATNTASEIEQAAEVEAMSLRTGVRTAVGTLKSGISGIGSAISGSLGLVSKAFFPLMIADLGAEFLKAPLGGMLAQNPQWQRAGTEMQSDLFGGIISLVTKSLHGADAAVGRADVTTIGNLHFGTVELAQLGVTNATFDKLANAPGTIEYAQGTLELLEQLTGGTDADPTNSANADKLKRLGNETGEQWYQRVQKGLDQAQQKVAGSIEYLIQRAPNAAVKAGYEDQLAQYMTSITSGQVDYLMGQTTEAFRDALFTKMEAHGWTSGQLSRLSVAQMNEIGLLEQKNTDGQLTFMEDYLINQMTQTVQERVVDPALITKTIGQMTTKFKATGWEAVAKAALADPDHNKNVKWLSDTLGYDWQILLSDAVASLHPSDSDANAANATTLSNKFGENWRSIVMKAVADPKSADNAPLVAYLKGLLKDDWQNLVTRAVGTFETVPLTPGGAEVKTPMTADEKENWTEQAKMAELRTTAMGAISTFWKGMTKEEAQALDDFVKDTKGLDPGTLAELKTKFGANWLEALRTGTDAIPDGSQLALKLQAAFGSTWRSAIAQFGTMKWQSEGGADADALKQGMVDLITAKVNSLTPESLNAADATKKVQTGYDTTTQSPIITSVITALTAPLSAKDAAKATANIQALVTKSIADGTVAALGGTDPVAVAAAWKTMGDGLTTMILDPAQRDAFLTQVQAIAQLNTLPDGQTTAETLADTLPTLEDSAKAAADKTGELAQNIQNQLIPAIDAMLKIKPSPPAPLEDRDSRLPDEIVSAPAPFDPMNIPKVGGGKAFGGRTGGAQWVGEFGPELWTAAGAGNVSSNSKVAAMLQKVVAQAMAGDGAAGKSVGDQYLHVEQMNVAGSSERKSVLAQIQFLAPGGR